MTTNPTPTGVQIRPAFVRVRVDGEWLRVTNHVFDRFEQRLSNRTRELFPHFDLSRPRHLLAAVCSLLRESRSGWTWNRKRGRIYGRRAQGWFFVVKSGAVVTCYPARGYFVEE